MKKIAILFVISLLMISMVMAIEKNTVDPACQENCKGAVWTTDVTGEVQNKNLYMIGEPVYVNGKKLPKDYSCNYIVKNLPHNVVASGNLTTTSSGTINAFMVYTPVAEDAGEEFKVEVLCGRCKKSDNFKVGYNEVPEFSTLAALIALVGSVGVFMIIRRKH